MLRRMSSHIDMEACDAPDGSKWNFSNHLGPQRVRQYASPLPILLHAILLFFNKVSNIEAYFQYRIIDILGYLCHQSYSTVKLEF